MLTFAWLQHVMVFGFRAVFSFAHPRHFARFPVRKRPSKFYTSKKANTPQDLEEEAGEVEEVLQWSLSGGY
jgi:hypothetical protein